MTWYCLQYNNCPRCIFQADSIEEANSTRVKFQEWLDNKFGYTYYVYCFEVPLVNTILK